MTSYFLHTNSMNFQFYKANCDFFACSNSTYIIERTDPHLSEINIATIDHQSSLLIEGEEWISNIDAVLEYYLLPQLQSPSRVFMERVSSTRPVLSNYQIFSEILDSDQLITIDQLSCLSDVQGLSSARIVSDTGLIKDSLLLGSLSILYIPYLLNLCPNIESFLVVETDPQQLAALMCLVDIQDIVSQVKQAKKTFSLIFQPDSSSPISAHILEYIGTHNPMALNGLIIFKSPRISPELIVAESWCHSPDGLIEQAKGFLGNDTDEINQSLNAIWNALSHTSTRLLKQDVLCDDFPLIITASGPSLDKNLSWLREKQDSLSIVAAGSSCGALLRNGIVPDIIVLLEMSSVVFYDLCDLLYEGLNFKGIYLVCSSSIDPRVPALFPDKTIFFHRPLLSSSSLFPTERGSNLPQAGPQAANAALEVAIQLGSRKLLLLGCDFAASTMSQLRSRDAMGSSQRDLTMPIRGRLGSTVFSSPELSTTKQFFENILSLFGVEVASIGDGAYIEGVKPYSEPDQITNPEQFCSEKSIFYKALSQLPVRGSCSNQLVSNLSAAFDSQQKRSVELIDLISRHRQLDASLSKQFAAYLGWDDRSYSPDLQFVHRLTRFIYFFMLQPLHDLPHDRPEEWLEVAEKTVLCINKINDLILVFLKMLHDLSENADHLPIFDHNWIRRRFNYTRMTESSDLSIP